MLLFGVLVGRFCFLNVDSKTKLEFDSKAKLSLLTINSTNQNFLGMFISLFLECFEG